MEDRMSDVQRFTTIQNLRAFVEVWPEDALQDSSINGAPVIKVADILYAYDALAREVEGLQNAHRDTFDKWQERESWYKQQLQATHDTHEQDHDRMLDLERQLAEAQHNMTMYQDTSLAVMTQLKEAQQRTEELRDERDGCLQDKMNWERECKRAEARLAEVVAALDQFKRERGFHQGGHDSNLVSCTACDRAYVEAEANLDQALAAAKGGA